jgi:hypothetical protein
MAASNVDVVMPAIKQTWFHKLEAGGWRLAWGGIDSPVANGRKIRTQMFTLGVRFHRAVSERWQRATLPMDFELQAGTA